MSNYYYFVCSLPRVEFDSKTALNAGEFLEEARKWLNKKDFDTLSQCILGDYFQDNKAPLVLRQIRAFEFRLREETAYYRRTKKEKEMSLLPSAWFRSGNPSFREKELLRV